MPKEGTHEIAPGVAAREAKPEDLPRERSRKPYETSVKKIFVRNVEK